MYLVCTSHLIHSNRYRAYVWTLNALFFQFISLAIVTQVVGIVAIGAFTVIVSAVVWFALKFTMGLRVDEEDEFRGLDQAELGLEAYPEFGPRAQVM